VQQCRHGRGNDEETAWLGEVECKVNGNRLIKSTPQPNSNRNQEQDEIETHSEELDMPCGQYSEFG
jgi:hypothetical protein